jgi:hypothetical protein
VKKAVEDRDAGLSPATQRARMIDDQRDVLEGWVTDSKERSAVTKPMSDSLRWAMLEPIALPAARWLRSNPNGDWAIRGCTDRGSPPGLWLQYDFGDGPIVEGRKVVLLVAWLAWCRYRVVVPLRDRTAPSVFAPALT